MSSGHPQTQLPPGLVRPEGLIIVAAMESQMLLCLVSGNCHCSICRKLLSLGLAVCS